MSEHEKLYEVKDKSQVIGEFLDWLNQEKEIYLCTLEHQEGYARPAYVPSYYNVQNLLAEFFEIDLNRLEKEKLEMLEELRKPNGENHG